MLSSPQADQGREPLRENFLPKTSLSRFVFDPRQKSFEKISDLKFYVFDEKFDEFHQLEIARISSGFIRQLRQKLVDFI